MRKWAVILSILLLCKPSLADVTSPTEWTENDGSPSVYNPWRVSVSNGTLTDNGDGSVTVTTTGGTPGSGSPGTPNNSYQYNDGGVFAGNAAFTFDTTTTTATATSLLANIFTVGTSTGVRATATGGVLTLTEQNGSGTKNELTFDLENNSRITAMSNTRPTFLWRGNNTGTSLVTSFSNNGDASFDAASNLSTGNATHRFFPEGNNDWTIGAGGSATAGANYLSINSTLTGKDFFQLDKSTGQATFLGGGATTSTIKTGTGGSGIDYRVLEVDGETLDMTSTWLEDEAILKITSSELSGNVGLIIGPATSTLTSVLGSIISYGVGSGFGVSGGILGVGFLESQIAINNGSIMALITNTGSNILSGEPLGQYSFNGRAGANLPLGADIVAYATENWTDTAGTETSVPAKIQIRTVPSGAILPVVRMDVGSNGDFTFNTTASISNNGTIMGSAFQVSTATGVRGTGTAATFTLTEQQSAGTKTNLTFDVANNSRITASSNVRNAFVWMGAGGSSSIASYAPSGSSFVDSSSDLSTGSANFRLSPEGGTNPWQFTAGGSANAGAQYLAINSSIHGANVVRFDKTTGNTDFLGHTVTTTGMVNAGSVTSTTTIVGSGTVGNTQAFLGKSTNVGCVMIRDTDDAGWTECVALNGSFSCGIDLDGSCDGTP